MLDLPQRARRGRRLRQGPAHGQDTEVILQELDYDWDDIIALKGEGAVL